VVLENEIVAPAPVSALYLRLFSKTLLESHWYKQSMATPR
jgi:hypothetical protein